MGGDENSMNSRERFLAAFHGQQPDRPPVAHVAALTTVELQELTGCRMPEAHHAPAGQARLLYANHEVLGLDAVTFLINFFNTSAALGVEMDWGDSATLPAFKSHPWRSMDDALAPDDLFDRQPIRNCLETLRIAKRDYGDRIFNFDWAIPPKTMVAEASGAFRLMGNANTADLLMGTPEQIEGQVVECLEAGVEIISPGCAISPKCPVANLRAMTDAVVDYTGRV